MLSNPFLQPIADALTKDECNKKADINFYSEQVLSKSEINISVENLGEIALPLTKSAIEELVTVSSQAKFGLREKTLLDKSVRDTQEITADKLNVVINNAAMTSLMNKVKHALGIREEIVLTPHLHNLLVYKPGQFFNKHQDSEKLENMVATLVIVLPSAHIGGNLVVEHDNKKFIFSSENVDALDAKCLAFYADCVHCVEEVRQGCRVALTYNLVLASDSISLDKTVNQQLKEVVDNYFDDDHKLIEELPKLAYFLDHSYSEHSLKWELLKGNDQNNAASLLAVAKSLNLRAHLALVEIHECWSTDGDEDVPELYDLIDSDTSLTYWVDPHNIPLSYEGCGVSEDEICYKTDTKTFKPYDETIAGYMGNYGDTADYWYRRAAVVLWPESKQVAFNFKLNYDTALAELETLTQTTGHKQTVIDIVDNVGEGLFKRYYAKGENSHFASLTNIALYVEDADRALDILVHFKWDIINLHYAESLCRLQNQYGVEWCIQLVEAWRNNKRDHDSLAVLDQFDQLVKGLVLHGADEKLLQLLFKTQCTAILARDKRTEKHEKPAQFKKTLAGRIATARAFLEASTTMLVSDRANPTALDELISHLITNQGLYPELTLAEMILSLRKAGSQKLSDCFSVLENYLRETIHAQLQVGQRSSDDWSISIALRCHCEHCEVAAEFLHSKTETKKVWPIVGHVRDHVAQSFRDLDLPVDLSVEKKGSPHKLVMIKNERLHVDAQKNFNQLRLIASQI